MRLVIAMRPEWTWTLTPVGVRVDVRPGLRFLVEHAQPIPLDTRAWGDRVVFADLPPSRVKVIRVDDGQTGEGWTFTYVVSDTLESDGSRAERRIHAIVRFAQHAVVVTARAADAPLIDDFDPVFRARIVSSRVDFDDIAALAHVWDGLEFTDHSPPSDVISQTSG